ncbi:MAG: signal peptidase I [Solobacterium sp.]|jgi:signal peptidase I|nr:signal peptidase I [Solobacterium sp.]
MIDKNTTGQPQTDNREARLKKLRYDRHHENLITMIEGFVIVAIIVFILFYFVFGITSVSGNSMNPNYTDGQTVLFVRINKTYSVGDVVGIKMTKGDSYIKRIVAVAGDTVDLQDGVLYVNGSPKTETYAIGTTQPESGDVTYPLTLKDQEYFVLGDNREASIDSRSFGPVVESQIEGKILG